MKTTDNFTTIHDSIMKLPPGLHFCCKPAFLQDISPLL